MPKPRFVIVILLASFAPLVAAPPPDSINYQGVLRDNAGAAFDGSVDMVFRFYSAESAGDEILIDSHLAANTQAIPVSDGLFNVALGRGAIADGAGPGSYAGLAEIFRDYDDVWLETQIGAEVLSPRVKVHGAAFASNALHLEGRTAAEFLDTSSLEQAKPGKLIVGTSSGTAESVGLEVYGDVSAATFRNNTAASVVYMADSASGISSFGQTNGGVFLSFSGSGTATVAGPNFGISASGGTYGGRFTDTTESGDARLGWGDIGISASGSSAGGWFEETGRTTFTRIADSGYGILATGPVMGGYFTDENDSGVAYVAEGNRGVRAQGIEYGGRFSDANASGNAYIGFGDLGIHAQGSTAGGLFEETDNDSYAYIATADYGLKAYGRYAGGYFEDLDGTSYARIARLTNGVEGYGINSGGYFEDTDDFTWAFVGHLGSSIFGNGAKNFVQNHPEDPGKVIFYSALEGDEVGTYTRGHGRLEAGKARLGLGETFRWVTHPDLGLTVQLTPRGADADLHVVSVSTEELVVAGSADVEFDYVVMGLRIGFERAPVVRAKETEAYLPDRSGWDAIYEDDPQLASFNAESRFRGMRRSAPDLSAGRRLTESLVRPATASERPATRTVAATDTRSRERDVTVAAASREIVAQAWLPVAEAVEAGDLLAIDTATGTIRRATVIGDPQIVGVAVGPSRADVDGTLEVPVADGRYARIRVDAAYGEIRAGDRLIASATPGHAMRAGDVVHGGLLGRAVEGLDVGQGVIRVLLTLR